MKKTVRTLAILGAAATLLAANLTFAGDETRIRDQIQKRDQTCLSTQKTATQTRQMKQQRLNQGAGFQTRTQKQAGGK